MNLIQIYAKTNYMYTEPKDIEGFCESFGHKKSPETRTITPDANKGNNHYYNEKTLKVDWSCLMERERRFTKTAIQWNEKRNKGRHTMALSQNIRGRS